MTKTVRALLTIALPLALALGGCASLMTPQGETYAKSGGAVRWPVAAQDFVAGQPASTRAFLASDAVGPADYQRKPDTGYVALGNGGSMVLDFGNHPVSDGPGMDLVVIEVGPVGTVEPTTVEVSTDGVTWQMVGVTAGARSTLDLSEVAKNGESFRFVRVRDAKGGLSDKTNWPGADVDTVGALHWSDAR